MRLSYETLKAQKYGGYLLQDAPEKVLQFGTGNFLRAFAEDFIDRMNECAGFNGKVVVSRLVRSDREDEFAGQDGLYMLLLRGCSDGQPVSCRRVISCVSRCIDPYRDFESLLSCARNPDLQVIISNSTEAGIVYDPACGPEDAPPASFPAKLTRFMMERYRAGLPGFVILACELIDNNGGKLRDCVLAHARQWRQDEDFLRWIQEENLFCSTLVDRIVTGFPAAEAEALQSELGYEDRMLTAGEIFASWVIEGPEYIREILPFEKAGLPVMVVDDVRPYKQRKVRLLNGAHTSMVTAAYLAGQDIVRGCMEHPVIRDYLYRTLHKEIIPAMTMPVEELEAFAGAVIDRFRNPYIDHRLLAIALNSTSKWRARVLPSLKDYLQRFDCLPKRLTFSLAAQIAFYANADERKAETLAGRRNGDVYEVRDDAWVLDFYARADRAALVHDVLSNERMWGEDLTKLPGFEAAVSEYLARIGQFGMLKAMETLSEEADV